MLTELRTYRCAPGRREEWLTLFHEVVLPFMASRGMVVVASYIDETDPDVHVWLRRFDDEAHRAKVHEAVYQDPTWKNEIVPRTKGLVVRERIEVRRLVPTSGSPLR
ncbi:NIPSNAP family protein [Pseudonocardia sp. WMMC193]|uniref:NIPSNAP family protein n=1 Tax=Pseudonocardia sp. WMMC193 TaxID=2911965 RepID=UPI001F3A09F0|nr:NIPSNAP family protein [Pseudonocardia sp. WMMC193]MCF7550688.1 NIPSNAP family protein [Pseudonocardia sp. WMMC193]